MREFSNEIKKYDIYCYEISSDSTNIKNNAILKAGNTDHRLELEQFF